MSVPIPRSAQTVWVIIHPWVKVVSPVIWIVDNCNRDIMEALVVSCCGSIVFHGSLILSVTFEIDRRLLCLRDKFLRNSLARLAFLFASKVRGIGIDAILELLSVIGNRKSAHRSA